MGGIPLSSGFTFCSSDPLASWRFAEAFIAFFIRQSELRIVELTMRRPPIAKIIKCVFGLLLVLLGIGMFIDPVASDSFYPGGKYSGPHPVHYSAAHMKIEGATMTIFGLVILFFAIFNPRK
jgi:hypothetical protein